MEPYLIGYTAKKNKFMIVLSDGATPLDVIQAMLLVAHAHSLLSIDPQLNIEQVIEKSFEYSKVNRIHFQSQLQIKGWDVDAVFWGDRGIRSSWSSPS
jgi:hypothetical protein